MRLTLALIVVSGCALAQPPEPQAKPPEPQSKPDEKPSAAAAKTDTPAAAKTDTQAAASPAPSTEEPWINGSFDFGYRWVALGGSPQSYRSVVNLGEGPKLIGLEFTILNPKKRGFDRLSARANGWGGDPYNTAHLDVSKRAIYDFSADYRDIAYFNALPTFANPLAPAGFNEQSFDTHRRMAKIDLTLFPGRHVIPYLSFDRNSGYGHGVTTWVQDANDEFAVPTLQRDSSNNYRGGVRLEFNRYHLTLEEGGTTFKNDDQASASGVNPGDRTTLLSGQTLVLNTLQQAYGIRGTSKYSKLLVTVSPSSWIDLSGQFLYSEPKTNIQYTDGAVGNFALLSSLLFYSGQRDLGTGAANAPHVSGNAGFELRPFRRLRIVESWITDHYHDAAFSLVAEQILFTGTLPGERTGTIPGQTLTSAMNALEVVNNNQEQVDVLLDVTSKLTLRGGFRHVWGDASVRAGLIDPLGPQIGGELSRNVGLAGLTFRPSQRFSFNLDYEGAATDRTYFRTSLYNYQRVRARARYQLNAALSVQANFTLLNNQNPTPGIQNDFQSRDNSVSLYWTPGGGKRISVVAEYDRSSMRSNVDYLGLFFAPGVSSYLDNAHTASSTVDLALPTIAGMAPKISMGGSLMISNGTRSSRYYQPLGRLSLPLQKHVSWNTEWRWYGFGEQLYLFEGFRAHVFMTGLRLTK
ncbi:MAG TPA: hypothetical protein VNY05_43795 [Candidatus Acidoferrales bacterium]|nr:hypothetical protein [Candidatus Acidoferrales bacterium]